ncbi:hypothetical protein [Nitrososphaeria virus YSH_174770]|uniref:Uncharacterized protein n=1 Tax=Nitrososphaeria virus YSH_174770 TaxID=3071322 RepID=A0A976UBH0_9CAUD|nr:hypothetical protein QKV93_gp16 [Yangshan Harbor Nitrososphaeria virus]UVF62361.1 hypothetical protein [Nitrososphaeria virus YSH_174770]
MLVPLDYEKIMENFSTSVNTLIDDIIKEIDVVKENDPDPERTIAHMVDRKIRLWFRTSGGLGY